ncbi:MAG: hypothetical protein O6933_07735 [Planctomycetota bacterium]|nr:hypothetical protein [Planctomycetota bacterium]
MRVIRPLEVASAASCEVVNHNHVITSKEKMLYKMRANEARAAGHKSNTLGGCSRHLLAAPRRELIGAGLHGLIRCSAT